LGKSVVCLDRLHQGFPLGDLLREFRREVCPLAKIRFQVVQFVDLLAAVVDCVSVEERVGLEVLPLALANSRIVC